MIEFEERTYGCPVELTLTILGGKWKTVILSRIKEGASRFGALRRAIPQLSARVLTQRLRELEEHGLITRTVVKADPPQEIIYGLSARGESLRPVLEALWKWGETTVAGRSPAE